MKAWRQRENQWQFVKDVEALGQDTRKLPVRLGKLVRDNRIRILPTPSFLVQRLFIRAGLMKGA